MVTTLKLSCLLHHGTDPGDHRELYKRYKNLFFLLKGKRWLLKPHAIRSVTTISVPDHQTHGAEGDGRRGNASHSPISNIFSTHSGVVLALGFGAPRAVVTVELSSDYVNPNRTATVHHAGPASSAAAPKSVADGAGVEYVVALGDDGEAMLQIPY